MTDTVDTVNVALPGGKVWRQRTLPDGRRFGRWQRLLHGVALQPLITAGVTETPAARKARRQQAAQRVARARERVALLAAFDGGWDVTDAQGRPLPSPARLTLKGWNAVPREVIEAILRHVTTQADAGAPQLAARIKALAEQIAEQAAAEAAAQEAQQEAAHEIQEVQEGGDATGG